MVEITRFHILRAVATTWGLIGIFYWFDKASPLGWISLRYKTKAEMDMAGNYVRGEAPYPGDADEVESYMQRGGSANTIIPPRLGRDRTIRKTAQVKLQEAQLEKEALKLFLRMRREAVKDLRSQGLPVE